MVQGITLLVLWLIELCTLQFFPSMQASISKHERSQRVLRAREKGV